MPQMFREMFGSSEEGAFTIKVLDLYGPSVRFAFNDEQTQDIWRPFQKNGVSLCLPNIATTDKLPMPWICCNGRAPSHCCPLLLFTSNWGLRTRRGQEIYQGESF